MRRCSTTARPDRARAHAVPPLHPQVLAWLRLKVDQAKQWLLESPAAAFRCAGVPGRRRRRCERRMPLPCMRLCSRLALPLLTCPAAVYHPSAPHGSGMDDLGLTAYVSGLLGEYLAQHWQERLAQVRGWCGWQQRNRRRASVGGAVVCWLPCWPAVHVLRPCSCHVTTRWRPGVPARGRRLFTPLQSCLPAGIYIDLQCHSPLPSGPGPA